MNYKNLVFTSLIAVSFMSHGAEPKSPGSRFIFSIPVWGATSTGAIMILAGYHWYKSDFYTKEAKKPGVLRSQLAIRTENPIKKAAEHKRDFWFTLKLSALSAGALGLVLYSYKQPSSTSTTTSRRG